VPTITRPRAPHLTAVMRSGESVTPLELFFDLVFVLALTQCTALMADDPTWGGLARGLIAYEKVQFADLRDRLRHQLVEEPTGERTS